MRTRHAAALVAVTAVTAAGAGFALSRDGTATDPTGAPTAVLPSLSGSRAAVLPSLPVPTRTATRSGVTSLLRTAMTDPALGAGVAAAVVDTASGTTLYDRDAGNLLPPASTTKLLTATAALSALGPDATLTTSTARAGSTLYLVGGGDVTITESGAGAAPYPRPASLRVLADRTVRSLSGTRRVRLRLDVARWTGPGVAAGWSRSYLTEGDIARPSPLELDEGRVQPGLGAGRRAADPAAAAGARFAALLAARHVHVVGRVRRAAAPSGAVPLAEVRSPTVAELVQQMLTTSDNDLAEALGRAVALHDHRSPSFAGAAGAVTARVHSIGVPAADMRLRDTSGLSRQDRVSPRALTDLLTAIASPARTRLRPILAGLPVAGFSGTLANRYRRGLPARAAGALRAKTGTLRGVSSLAGYVVDRDGQLLAFAVIAAHAPAPSVAEAALDRLAARLVRCGCTV